MLFSLKNISLSIYSRISIVFMHWQSTSPNTRYGLKRKKLLPYIPSPPLIYVINPMSTIINSIWKKVCSYLICCQQVKDNHELFQIFCSVNYNCIRHETWGHTVHCNLGFIKQRKSFTFLFYVAHISLDILSKEHYGTLKKNVIHPQFLSHTRYIYDFVVLYLCIYLFLWGIYEQRFSTWQHSFSFPSFRSVTNIFPFSVPFWFYNRNLNFLALLAHLKFSILFHSSIHQQTYFSVSSQIHLGMILMSNCHHSNIENIQSLSLASLLMTTMKTYNPSIHVYLYLQSSHRQ